MIVQVNTDNHIEGGERLNNYVTDTVTAEFAHHSENIRRIEVYFADENAAKQGTNDKRCTIELHVAKQEPIAATAHGDNLELALNAAVDKIGSSLAKMFDRLQDHHKQ